MRCKIDGWMESPSCTINCDCHRDPRNMQAGPIMGLIPNEKQGADSQRQYGGSVIMPFVLGMLFGILICIAAAHS